MDSPRLLVADPLGRRTFPIDKPILTIGRGRDADITLSGMGISRVHAEIVTNGGISRLRDRASKGGTFTNGEPTTDRVLAHGDRIRLAQSDTEIVFLTTSDTLAAAPTAIAAADELRHMAKLLEGLRALGSERALDDVLAMVLDSALEVTNAERGFIMLANGDGRLEFKLARAKGGVTLSDSTFATSLKIPEAVFATGQETIANDLTDEGIAPLHMGTVALGIRRVLCTPLRFVRYVERGSKGGNDKIIGVLYLDDRARGGLTSAAARAALGILSAEAGTAIENARLYREALDNAKLEQELSVAATIQQSLLPVSNRTGAFCTAAGTSTPCRAVGGDFFDYVNLPTGEFSFIVGDVSGKGAPAAILAAAALGMFGAEAMYEQGAASLIKRLNTGLVRRAIQARFLTAFYGLIGQDGSFTYSNAGHNAPVLATPNGTRRLDVGGMVLGLFNHVSFEEETLALSPGDVIVAFSDGVTEALNDADEEFGDARLLACVEAHRRDTPRAIADALVAEVKAFCGAAPTHDDVTVVVVRYDGG